MKIKDLTKDQILEIVHLLYPFKDWIKSEIEINYQNYEDSPDGIIEYQFAKFEGIVFGDTTKEIRVFIYPTLNCAIDYLDFDKTKNLDYKTVIESLPVRNQRKIQEKFTEFGF